MYHYGFPNVFIWLYPPFEINDLEKTKKYFEKLKIYNKIVNSKNCEELNQNLLKTEQKIEKVLFNTDYEIDLFGCDDKLLFYNSEHD